MRVTDRFHIRITKSGYAFIGLCLGVGFAGLNTGNNLLYLVFSMMLSFLILSGLLSNNSLKKLSVRVFLPQRIFAKEPVPVRFELKNGKVKFPSYSLLIRPDDSVRAEEAGAFIIKIPPKESDSAISHVKFPKRGRHATPDFTVETTYPFGFIRKILTIPSEGETIVYPNPLPLNREILADRRQSGEFLSGQSGGTSNPYGIRDLTQGDPARLIHWKSSARTGQLKVKEFEREKKLKVLLDVFLSPPGPQEETLLEKAISASTAMLLDLNNRGYEVSLRVNGETVEPIGRGYLDSYLIALALAKPSREFQGITGTHDSVIRITNSAETTGLGALAAFIGPKELATA